MFGLLRDLFPKSAFWDLGVHTKQLKMKKKMDDQLTVHSKRCDVSEYCSFVLYRAVFVKRGHENGEGTGLNPVFGAG